MHRFVIFTPAGQGSNHASGILHKPCEFHPWATTVKLLQCMDGDPGNHTHLPLNYLMIISSTSTFISQPVVRTMNGKHLTSYYDIVSIKKAFENNTISYLQFIVLFHFRLTKEFTIQRSGT